MSAGAAIGNNLGGNSMDHPEKEKPRDEGKWVILAGLFLTLVATAASAYSAWLSYRGLEEARHSQLLNRRLDACFEVRKRAADQIDAALGVFEEKIEYSPVPENENGRGATSYSYPAFDYQYDALTCRGSASEVLACEKENKRRRSAAIEKASVDAHLQSEKAKVEGAALRFEAARAFDLLASKDLFAAEDRLSAALGVLSNTGSKPLKSLSDPRIAAAKEALHEFSTACAEATGPYR